MVFDDAKHPNIVFLSIDITTPFVCQQKLIDDLGKVYVYANKRQLNQIDYKIKKCFVRGFVKGKCNNLVRLF